MTRLVVGLLAGLIIGAVAVAMMVRVELTTDQSGREDDGVGDSPPGSGIGVPKRLAR